MFGLNQAECCDGETAATCPVPTVAIASKGDQRTRPIFDSGQ